MYKDFVDLSLQHGTQTNVCMLVLDVLEAAGDLA